MYHRLDGKLFAVGVLDFSPQVLSSVYFFYDPAYEALSPGVLGALREIEYTRRIRQTYSEAFRYYYMGFYIQTCQKSVYKGTYEPSELLCPETFRWVPLNAETREKITKKGYSRLAPPSEELIEDLRWDPEELEMLVRGFFFFNEGGILRITNLIERF